MNTFFYDMSVASYLQTLGAVAKVLERGETYAKENEIDLSTLTNYRLRDDMAPLTFQVVSVWHHSMGAIKGMQSGEFGPPPKMPEMDYAYLKGLVAEATEFLSGLDKADVNKLADQNITFRMGSHEIPFTTNNFVLSFSLPNFYFHASTTYAILRTQGVPLGKIDFLGEMRVGH